MVARRNGVPSNAGRRQHKGAALGHRRLGLVLTMALLCFAAPGRAGLHEQGNISLSFGGSLSHTFSYNKNLNLYAEVTGDFTDEAPVEESETYTDIDLSLYFSAGYFFINRMESGLSGSAMATWYPDGNQSDLEIYDLQLYTKYFFDNPSRLTPFLKLQAGASQIDTGSYHEQDATAGFVTGLEFSGMGAVVWFLEFSSLYTFNSGDITGEEWRNQLYIGISYYSDLLKKRKEARAAAQPPYTDQEVAPPDAVLLKLYEAWETQWQPSLDALDQRVGEELRQAEDPSPQPGEPSRPPGR